MRHLFAEFHRHEARAFFAAELRRYRHATRLTQKSLGARMSFSDSQVAMVEAIRDSKFPNGRPLVVTTAEWTSFLGRIGIS